MIERNRRLKVSVGSTMKYYPLSASEEACRHQNQELTEAELKEKAKKIHSQLNILDIS